jgi:hypothetical protein
MQSAESLKRRIEMEERNDFRSESPSGSTTIKVSDDSNSSEILVFTSLCNVYKVQKKELMDKFQALQKIDLEPGEKPIYLTGEKRYKGFLIVAFDNGKIGKISLDSFKTDIRKKHRMHSITNPLDLLNSLNAMLTGYHEQHKEGGFVQHLSDQCCGKQVNKRCSGYETEGWQFNDKS